MANSSTEVSPAAERIVQSFNGKDKSSNFEDVAREIYNLNRQEGFGMGASLDYINAQVNMKDLGFPEDFEIIGVEQNGSVRTRGASGQIQIRDGMHLEVQSVKEADVSNREWGGRQFTDNGDGTAAYTVQRGDNMWGISRSVMEERLGRKPTNAEVNEAYRQIAEANNITNPDAIKVGQELKIPSGYDQSSRDPYKPIDRKEGGLTEDAAVRRGEDNVFNALAAPGLPGTDGDWLKSQDVENVTRPDGSLQRKVTGQIDGNGINNPEYSGYQSMDAQGRLTDSHIEYSYGASLNFDTGNDYQRTINDVKSIDTTVNSTTGNYESTIRTAGGQIWRSVTNSDGQVVSFKQI